MPTRRLLPLATPDSGPLLQIRHALSEFKAHLYEDSISRLQALAQIFRRMDEEKTGNLSYSEFKNVSPHPAACLAV